jgi:crotonobetainyl-CoA hydratase
MSDESPLRVERDGRVTILTLDRPDALNAISPALGWALNDALDAFAADPDQWVAILTGTGAKAFSAGHDLKAPPGGGRAALPPGGFAGLSDRLDLDKPLIAAVNGVAMGGGFEIALACDIILAADHASFALPEPRVGLAALGGGLQRLPRSIGLHRAMAAILTARRISAAEGLALGFVHAVHPPADLLAEALTLARTICESSPLSIRASKAAALRAFDGPLAAQLADQWNAPAMQAMLDSADALEGPRAFAEKRAPVWSGR